MVLFSINYFDISTYIASGHIGLVHTNDGGDNWDFVWTFYDNGFEFGEIRTISVVNDSIAYTCGFGVKATLDSYSFILKTIDAGQSWEYVYYDDEAGWFYDLYAINKDTIFISDGGLHKSIDGGQNISQIFPYQPSPIRCIDFSNYPIGYVVGGNTMVMPGPITEFIAKTYDGGSDWEIQIDEPGIPLFNVNFINDTIGFAVGWDELILKTTNGGSISTHIKESKEKKSNVIIYPNPVNDFLFFKISDSITKDYNIEIFNAPGQLFYSQNLNTNCKIDVSGFPEGLYFVRISGNFLNDTKKVIIY